MEVVLLFGFQFFSPSSLSFLSQLLRHYNLQVCHKDKGYHHALGLSPHPVLGGRNPCGDEERLKWPGGSVDTCNKEQSPEPSREQKGSRQNGGIRECLCVCVGGAVNRCFEGTPERYIERIKVKTI